MQGTFPKSRFVIAGVLFCLVYVLFVAVYARTAERRMQRAVERHALILSGHLWDFSTESTAEYLDLMLHAEGYARAAVYHADGTVFVKRSAQRAPPSLQQFLERLHLVTFPVFRAPIVHGERTIGRMEAAWVNRNVYRYAAGFVVLLLTLNAHVLAWFMYRARMARGLAERQLEDNRRRLETVVTGAPILVFSINRNGVFTVCRGRALERLGWKREELIGRHVSSFAGRWPELESDLQRSLDGDTFHAQRRIGTQVLEVRFSPLTDRGAMVGVTGVATDVTDLEAALGKLRERDARMQEELDLARDIQRSLMPAECPSLEGFSFGLLYQPSVALSGDVLHFMPGEDGHSLRMVMADITGHGVAAALLSAMFKVIADDVFDSTEEPAEQMKTLDRHLDHQFPEYHFACAVCLELRTGHKVMHYVNAAQEPIFLFRRDGTLEALNEGGPAPGLIASTGDHAAAYRQEAVTLHPGDTILLFTDGLTEVWNAAGDELGAHRIAAWARSGLDKDPQALLDDIWRRVTDFARREALDDDVAAVAIRVHG